MTIYVVAEETVRSQWDTTEEELEILDRGERLKNCGLMYFVKGFIEDGTSRRP